MNAMQKVAWTEAIVSFAVLGLVCVLFPWLGHRARGSFGLLGILGFTMLFLRKRGPQVIVDERDREIERLATAMGVGTAWMFLFGTLIVITMWSAYHHTEMVSTIILEWLIWVQFSVCYGIKGLVAIVQYRKQQHAA